MTPFYLAGSAGRLLCVHFPAAGWPRPRRDLILLQPFGEEMNLSRHTVARFARRMAGAGTGVLVLDVHGTGDSEGDFAEGRWETWIGDVRAAIAWLKSGGAERIALLGLRLGALLAMEAASASDPAVDRVILWNPVANGRHYVNQFLRFRSLNLDEAVAAGEARESSKELRARLAKGESIHVVGYELSPALAADLDRLNLAELGRGSTARLDWFEVMGDANAPLSPAIARILEVWQAEGRTVAIHPVSDKPFWSLQTIEPLWADALIAATVGAVS